MDAKPVLNLIWCQFWDSDRDEPGGCLRDLGQGDIWELPALKRRALAAWARQKWGQGEICVVDGQGRRVDLARVCSSN